MNRKNEKTGPSLLYRNCSFICRGGWEFQGCVENGRNRPHHTSCFIPESGSHMIKTAMGDFALTDVSEDPYRSGASQNGSVQILISGRGVPNPGSGGTRVRVLVRTQTSPQVDSTGDFQRQEGNMKT